MINLYPKKMSLEFSYKDGKLVHTNGWPFDGKYVLLQYRDSWQFIFSYRRRYV